MVEIAKHRYPAIAKAAVEMSRCNGGINLDRSVADCLRELEPVIQHHEEAMFDLTAIDSWLARLSDEQLAIAVDGEEAERVALIAGAPDGTDMFLTGIFNHAA